MAEHLPSKCKALNSFTRQKGEEGKERNRQSKRKITQLKFLKILEPTLNRDYAKHKLVFLNIWTHDIVSDENQEKKIGYS